jgi:hypothetical protein
MWKVFLRKLKQKYSFFMQRMKSQNKIICLILKNHPKYLLFFYE